MQIGLIGLPGSGKTTIFQALTGVRSSISTSSKREAANLAVVSVPDERVDKLSEIFRPKRTIYSSVEFTDVAGLQGVDTARSKGFSSTFLAAARNVDVLGIVVGKFLPGSDPQAELEEIELELNLADLSVIQKRLERLNSEISKTPAARRVELEKERELLQRLEQALTNDKPIRELEISADEEKMLRGYGFLTAKPAFVILNVAETEASKQDLALHLNLPTVQVSGIIEAEIAELPPDDAKAFLEDLGLREPGINRVIKTAYDTANLISFFTVGEDEVRSWTVKSGATAVEAAGVIHSDFARGFIRAEVVHYDDFIRVGSLAEARRQGLLRLEGKNYIVKDGDICHFLANV